MSQQDPTIYHLPVISRYRCPYARYNPLTCVNHFTVKKILKGCQNHLVHADYLVQKLCDESLLMKMMLLSNPSVPTALWNHPISLLSSRRLWPVHTCIFHFAPASWTHRFAGWIIFSTLYINVLYIFFGITLSLPCWFKAYFINPWSFLSNYTIFPSAASLSKTSLLPVL